MGGGGPPGGGYGGGGRGGRGGFGRGGGRGMSTLGLLVSRKIAIDHTAKIDLDLIKIFHLPQLHCGVYEIFVVYHGFFRNFRENKFTSKEMYCKIDFTKYFSSDTKISLTPHHTVEITEFYCHDFFAKIPSNQCFTKDKLI